MPGRTRALRHRRQPQLPAPAPRPRGAHCARSFNLAHEFVQTAELERPEYRANPANRCYYCKTELYTHLSRSPPSAASRVIADGNNADDRGDYRPGRQAAREFGVRSPLDEAGLTKDEIRELSRDAGLPTWDEPASACLSSRIPYLSEVTEPKLQMIERAEEALRALGFRVCRVRHHDTLARWRSAATRCRARSSPRSNAAIVRGAQGRRLPVRVASTCRATAPAA